MLIEFHKKSNQMNIFDEFYEYILSSCISPKINVIL